MNSTKTGNRIVTSASNRYNQAKAKATDKVTNSKIYQGFNKKFGNVNVTKYANGAKTAASSIYANTKNFVETGTAMMDSAQNTKDTLNALKGLGNTLRNNRSFSNIVTSTSNVVDQAKKTYDSYKNTYASLKNTTARASQDFNKLVKTVNSTKYGNKLVTAAGKRYNAASNKAQSVSNKLNNFAGSVKNKVTGSKTYQRVASNKYVQ